ncbi:MAG: ribosomal protein S18-alanine N-acetyltransferase [Deltaproteobacteria bacterium]|nr:ribosomal protein S18-alanine N-acetyltransferase [Deltaproteobacteria bacterium]
MMACTLGITDLDEIVALEARAFPAGAWDRGAVQGSLDDRFGLHLGLRAEDGALVAVALGVVIFEHAELLRILVAPEQRQRGLGRALLDALVQACAALGAERLSLEVRAENGPAQALYTAIGMRQVGRRRDYYVDGEDALLYAIDLLPSPAPEPR